MAQETQVYSFFLDNPPTNQKLFSVKLIVNYRPKVGDSITDPVSLRDFRVMRVELVDEQGFVRVTDQGDLRVTDDGAIRVTKQIQPFRDQTLNYFVQPANNPQRISTWTTQRFDDDQTLKQLFR